MNDNIFWVERCAALQRSLTKFVVNLVHESRNMHVRTVCENLLV